MTMPAQVLQCPFCATASTRGTGLTAHIRGRHPKEYSKWIKDPNRLQAALKAPTPKKAANKSPSAVSGSAVCPECGKTFKNQAALGGHRAYLHKAPKKDSEPAKPQIVAVEAQRTQSPAPKPQLGNTDGNEGLSLLQRVQDQLAARKDSIETELARVDALRSEHESVIKQLAAIDQAMNAFRRP